MRQSNVGIYTWYALHLLFFILLLQSFTGCGKIKVQTNDVQVEHKITIDVEAFKTLCAQTESPETCIDDLITKYNQ